MMKKLVLTAALLFSGLLAMSQTKDEVVQSVRDRYYRITGGKVDLKTYSVSPYNVSEENGNVVIIKEEVSDGRFEYYFDANKKLPYFIYFASKNNKVNPDLRGYYNDEGKMVWFKENNEEPEISFYQIPHKDLYLRTMNAYHTVENRDLPANPQSKAIDEYIISVAAMEKTTDTIAYVSESDEGYYEEWDLAFRNKENEKVMTQSGAGGEHGSNETTVYFRDAQKVCEITKSTGWMGSYADIEILISYFKEGKLFREEKYKSYGENIMDPKSPFGFNRDGVVPEVRVY
ncbi:hypothetical protein GCM10011506_21840 [Marivirga lumbricoides]|uniref:DUF4412 domain-containing protein n=2 Tax=Marivirga lumbricoides TaxID=1046115 RepID=A0ABQ1M9P0_9BACT|nr:hypothetical protein GCM10011506_21840 [Marivirga lumbricoides]